MTDTANIAVNADQKSKEAYYTASQGQLIWSRFKKQKAAMVGAAILVWLVLSGMRMVFQLDRLYTATKERVPSRQISAG
jgi:hypothetical protein